MPHAYTKDQLVGQPAIGLSAEPSWALAGPPYTASVASEPRGVGLMGRETRGEVVLEWLNPTLPPEAIAAGEWNWTPALDPYWAHTGLMVDPSAAPST